MIEAERGPAPADIDLSREAEFSLGELRVSPSTREVRRNGSVETLEPRVMQVLVCLAKAGGAVVSREDLFESCWGGRHVGDDALQRCISRLRHLAQHNGSASFIIESIPRIGYRLIPADGPVDLFAPEDAMAAGVGAATVAAPQTARPWWRVVARQGPWAIAALAIAAVAVYVTFDFEQPRWQVDDMRVVIASPAVERWPALSPDGSVLAYSMEDAQLNRDIYLRPLGEATSRRLTSGPGFKYGPAWSPNGREIAYVRRFRDGNCRIMIVDAAGGAPREVARCLSASRPAWYGNQLLFSDAPNVEAPERIVRLDLTTGRRSDLSHPSHKSLMDQNPAWSPDGNWVSFLRLVDASGAQVVVIDSAGGNERVVGQWDKGEISHAWTADSQALIIAISNMGRAELWLYPLDGQPYILHRGFARIGRLSDLRNGRIAAEVPKVTTNLAVPAGKGGAFRVIDSAAGETWRPSYRADGTAAFVSDRSGKPATWIKTAGGAARMLPSRGGQPFGELAWSPDGSKLAVPVMNDGKASVALIDTSGTLLATLTTPEARDINRPAWTDDGKVLIIPAFDTGGGWRLWRAELEGSRVSPASSYGWRAILIHGSAIFQIQSGVAGIWQMDGGMRLLKPVPDPQDLALMEIDGDRILYLDTTKQPHVIMAQPIAGGPPSFVAEGPPYDQPFSFDPRLRQIVYFPEVLVEADIALLSISQH